MCAVLCINALKVQRSLNALIYLVNWTYPFAATERVRVVHSRDRERRWRDSERRSRTVYRQMVSCCNRHARMASENNNINVATAETNTAYAYMKEIYEQTGTDFNGKNHSFLCKLCPPDLRKVVRTSASSTTNLKRHVRLKHPDSLRKYCDLMTIINKRVSTTAANFLQDKLTQFVKDGGCGSLGFSLSA